MSAPSGAFIGQLKEIGVGLLTLEVNTIIKQGMSAQKMPEVPLALHQIIDSYTTYLGPFGIMVTPDLLALAQRRLAAGSGGESKPVADLLEAWRPDPKIAPVDEMTNGAASFEALRWAAHYALKTGLDGLQRPLGDEATAIFTRIRAVSRQLTRLVLQLKQLDGWTDLIDVTLGDLTDTMIKTPGRTLEIDPALVIMVRKAWDIGVETVVFQTVLQLDGDVVTRMASSLSTQDRQFLFDIHQRTVTVGVGQWKALFDLVASLIEKMGGLIFARA